MSIKQKEIKLIVLTPVRKVLEKMVKSVIVPSEGGLMGVLPGHSPLVATLGTGQLVIKDQDGESRISISNGFLEVENNIITVLTDTAEIN